MSRIADLLLEQGRIAADARRRSGALWGQAVQSLGQIPGQALEAYRTQQDREAAAIVAQRREERASAEEERQKAAEKRAQATFTGQQATSNLELEDKRRTFLGAGAEEVKAAGYSPEAFARYFEAGTRAGAWTPQDAEALTAAARTPDGLKRAIDTLAQQAPIRQPTQIDPTRPVVDPRDPNKVIRPGVRPPAVEQRNPQFDVISSETGAVVSQGTGAPVTYGQAQTFKVKAGGTLVARPASDGTLRYASGAKQGQIVTEELTELPRQFSPNARGTAAIPLSGKMPAAYQDALDRATNNLTPAKNAQWTETANRMADRGDFAQLGEIIVQAATEGENVDEKNVIRGRWAAVGALQDIQTQLNELKRSGVETGLFTGTVENLRRKIGQTGDPKLAAIGLRIQENLLLYRRSITGAAFGEKEGGEYSKIMPDYTNEEKLNVALVGSLLEAMDTRDRVYWDRKLGHGGASLVGAIRSDAISTNRPATGAAAPPPGGPPPPASTTPGAQPNTGRRIRYDMNGNPIP